eukprot:TRINITY_DN16087_c1_g2_i4.p1 TRINITY_DN16087_c1_g2~~TRINITY_DN16087_c1_g2_i4.p1  ORF type:complete len:732 (+),score=139.91 TRINITY_DN16087_c1_g2_i4:76-2196(+)
MVAMCPSQLCSCGNPCIRLTVKKDGSNCGRPFFRCALWRGFGCDFFAWADAESGSNSLLAPLPAACGRQRPLPSRRQRVELQHDLPECLQRQCYRVLYTQGLMRRRRNYQDGALLVASNGGGCVLNTSGEKVGSVGLEQGRWRDLNAGDVISNIGLLVVVDVHTTEDQVSSGVAFATPSTLLVPESCEPRRPAAVLPAPRSGRGRGGGRGRGLVGCARFLEEICIEDLEEAGIAPGGEEGNASESEAEEHTEQTELAALGEAFQKAYGKRPRGPLCGSEEWLRKKVEEKQQDNELRALRQLYEEVYGESPKRKEHRNDPTWLRQQLAERRIPSEMIAAQIERLALRGGGGGRGSGRFGGRGSAGSTRGAVVRRGRQLLHRVAPRVQPEKTQAAATVPANTAQAVSASLAPRGRRGEKEEGQLSSGDMPAEVAGNLAAEEEDTFRQILAVAARITTPSSMQLPLPSKQPDLLGDTTQASHVPSEGEWKPLPSPLFHPAFLSQEISAASPSEHPNGTTTGGAAEGFSVALGATEKCLATVPPRASLPTPSPSRRGRGGRGGGRGRDRGGGRGRGRGGGRGTSRCGHRGRASTAVATRRQSVAVCGNEHDRSGCTPDPRLIGGCSSDPRGEDGKAGDDNLDVDHVSIANVSTPTGAADDSASAKGAADTIEECVAQPRGKRGKKRRCVDEPYLQTPAPRPSFLWCMYAP